MPKDDPSILAVHSGALGDVILFGHLLSGLPGRVTLLAGGGKARLLAAVGVVDAAMGFESLPMHEVFATAATSDCRLPALLGRHDRLISCFLAGDRPAERRLTAFCRAEEAVFLPVRPPANFPGHLLSLWAQRLPPAWRAGAGPVDVTDPPCWQIPAEWREPDRQALADGDVANGPRAVIHPGAGSEEKCWPLERFIRLADELRADGLNVTAVLGPVEADRWRDGRIDRLRAAMPVLADAELPTVAGLLAAAELYVGNDSGASHLAAAVGTPTVALFGPTNPVHFRPLGRRVEVVAAGAMADIRVSAALAACRKALQGRHGRKVRSRRTKATGKQSAKRGRSNGR